MMAESNRTKLPGSGTAAGPAKAVVCDRANSLGTGVLGPDASASVDRLLLLPLVDGAVTIGMLLGICSGEVLSASGGEAVTKAIIDPPDKRDTTLTVVPATVRTPALGSALELVNSSVPALTTVPPP